MTPEASSQSVPHEPGPLAFVGTDTIAVVSTPTQAMLFALVWIGCGVAVALFLGRRGHEMRPFVGLGIPLGPLLIPLAVSIVRREALARPIEVITRRGEGPKAIVVLLEAGGEVADAVPLLRSLADQPRVVLAAPMPYESLLRPLADDELHQAARRDLENAAAVLIEFDPAQVLLPGALEATLPSLVEGEDDLILLIGAAPARSDELGELAGVPVVSVPIRHHDR